MSDGWSDYRAFLMDDHVGERPIVPRREEGLWEVRAYIGSPMRESGTHSRFFDHETAARDYEMELNSKPGTYCVGVYRRVLPYHWLGREAEALNG